MEVGKKVDEPGYVFAPYIFSQSTTQVLSFKDKIRIRKINKIFRNKDIVDIFQPSKSISTRYSTKKIKSSFYGVIQTKNPL